MTPDIIAEAVRLLRNDAAEWRDRANNLRDEQSRDEVDIALSTNKAAQREKVAALLAQAAPPEQESATPRKVRPFWLEHLARTREIASGILMGDYSSTGVPDAECIKDADALNAVAGKLDDLLEEALFGQESATSDTKRLDHVEEWLDDFAFVERGDIQRHVRCDWFAGDGGDHWFTEGKTFREAVDKSLNHEARQESTT